MTQGTSGTRPARRWRRLILLLLIVPFVGTLWVSLYARTQPTLLGFPFFYWYQFLWIGISAAITVLVYLLDRGPDGSAHDEGSA